MSTDPLAGDLAVSRRLAKAFSVAAPDLLVAIVLLDAHGVVEVWNRYAETLFGWAFDEAIGRRFSDLVVGFEEADVARSIASHARAGTPWSGVFRARRRDGHYIEINALVALAQDAELSSGLVILAREDVDELEQALEELANTRRLAQHMDEIRLETAREIGARLHDDLSYQYHDLLERSEAILRRNIPDPEFREQVEDLHRAQRKLVGNLQGIWRSLRPPLLDEFGLLPAIEHLADSVAHAGEVEIDCEIDREVNSLQGPVREVILLVVQEALANVVSHAHATHCTLTVSFENGLVSMEVTDDGLGYRGQEGFGLRLMRERVRRFGGFVELDSGPRGGTTLRATVDSSSSFTGAVETLLDPHVMLRAIRDRDGTVSDFLVTDANDAALVQLRLNRDELVGGRLLEVTTGARRDQVFTVAVQTVNTGAAIALDDILLADEFTGELRHYDLRAVKSGDSVGFTWRDVTDRIEMYRQWKILIENIGDVVLLVDPVATTIQWISPSVTEMLGWSAESLIGVPLVSIVRDGERRTAEISRMIEQFGEARVEIEVRHANGSFKWIESRVRLAFDKTDGAFHRISSWRDMDTEVTARRALDTLSKVALILVTERDETTMLHQICETSVSVCGYQLVWYGRRIDDDAKSVTYLTSSLQHQDYAATVATTWEDSRMGRGPLGTALRTGEPVVFDDLATEPDYEPWRATALEHGFGSSGAFPVIVNGAIDGAIQFYATEPHAFSDLARSTMESLALAIGARLTELRQLPT